MLGLLKRKDHDNIIQITNNLAVTAECNLDKCTKNNRIQHKLLFIGMYQVPTLLLF